MRLLAVLAILFVIPACAQTKRISSNAGTWSKRVTRNPIDDTTKTVFLLASTDRTAYLHFECTSNVLFADNRRGIDRNFYITTTRFLEPEQNITVRIDKDDPMHLKVIRSSDFKGVFIDDNGFMKGFYRNIKVPFPDDEVDYTEFIPSVMQADRLLIQLTIFEGTEHLWEFHPNGINMDEVERVCKISESQPRDPHSVAIDRSK